MPPAAAAPEDFGRLYEAHVDYVWASLRRLGVPTASLEDVCHDVFVTAWRKLADYDASRPLRPWLFGIAYRTASDFRARAHHHREVADDEADAADDAAAPDEVVAKRQAQTLVRAALLGIPEDRRGVFVMHDLDGTPIPEVATTFGIPLNTAYSRLRLARRDFEREVARLNGDSA